MSENNYTLYRGDTFAEKLVFEDTDDVTIDITGWTIFFTIKQNKTDEDADALVSKTITDIPNPTLGEYTLTVDASELNALEGNYYYDFQIKLADGKIYTLISGTITFIVDITRRIA
jgi:hypothetical protein